MPYVPNWQPSAIDYKRIQQMQDNPEFQFYSFLAQPYKLARQFGFALPTPVEELRLLEVAAAKFPSMKMEADRNKQLLYRHLVRWNQEKKA